MADRVDQQLGNYRLVKLLGEGGYAEVYLGEHIHLATQAAIKVLHTKLTSENEEQFLTEARTIAHLEHTHIVRILDYGIEDKTPFLVLSYASKGSLRQLHPKGTKLSLSTVVSYVNQIAEALHYAHNEKIIHRDIKPENMLVERNNEILLSDFGIAQVTHSSDFSSLDQMAGTIS
jgi:eukaryotic-like serine/threonine-protein kinase